MSRQLETSEEREARAIEEMKSTSIISPDVAAFLKTQAVREYENNVAAETSDIKLLDLKDLSSENIPSPPFTIEHIVPKGDLTLLGGHGGSGKSALALSWACHVACGRSWAGLAVERGDVLYVSLEDPGWLIKLRIKSIAIECHLPLEQIAEHLVVADVSSGACELVRECDAGRMQATDLYTRIADISKGKSLVIIDNASDAFPGNENARPQVRYFMRKLREIAHAENAAVVLLAHIDKNAAKYGSLNNSYSGSTAWHNSARSRLALIADDGKPILLRHEKSNLAPRMKDPINLVFAGRALVVMAATSGNQADAQDDELVKAMRVAISRGAVLPAARRGSPNFAGILKTYGFDIGDHVYESLDRLLDRGTASIVLYKKDYKEKQRIDVIPEVRQYPPVSASFDIPDLADKELASASFRQFGGGGVGGGGRKTLQTTGGTFSNSPPVSISATSATGGTGGSEAAIHEPGTDDLFDDDDDYPPF